MLHFPKIILGCIVCVSFLVGNIAFAETNKSAIAIVDMDVILSDSLAGKSIQTQLSSKRDAFQKEFAARENTLLETEKKLIQEKSTLSAEAFETKRKAFDTQLTETRNLFQKRRSALDKGLNKSLATLRENIMTLTAKIAEAEGYSIVLTRDSVVIMDKNLDITGKVLTQMNATTQSIPLEIIE